MGASAKRAHRLQERRSLQRKDSVFRRCRRRGHIRQKFPSVALLDRVARGYREQCRRRFRPLNVRQCVGRISKTGIRMRALDVHLQVRRIPPLRHHGNRLLVADLSRGNRSRNPRTFRIHSVDRLRPERFGFGIGIRRSSFELVTQNKTGPARPASRSQLRSRSHPHVARHLPRHFLVGLQHVGRPRYWIADHYERVRLTGSRQRTNCRKRHLFANSALAVPVQICLRLPHDVIAVGQDLRRLRNRNGAERRSLHHSSAMQPAKAEQFNVIRKERVALDPHTSLDHYRAWTFLRSGHSAFLDHYLPLRWSSLCFLRSRRSRAHKKSSRQYRAHPSQFSLHFSFSSSLPNCCQIFAVAISAIPAFTRPSKIVQKFLRTFSLSQTAVFTLSQNAVVPICISPELDARRSRQYYCGSRTACGNPSSPTSKSTWIHSLASSSLTGKPSAPSAPRCRRTRRIAASPASVTTAPGKNVKPLSSFSATSVWEAAAPAEPRCCTAPPPCTGATGLGTEFAVFPAEFVTLGVDFSSFGISFGLPLRQFIQLTAPTNTAAAASAHAAITAVRRTFNVTCRVRNSWRKRISTRAGACAMAVSSANAPSSTPAACQESCNAAQREQVPACSIAAARSAALNDALRSASNPIASNSSHVISCFICITQNPSPRNARALRHAAKYFQSGHQQGATAVQPRTNSANRASRHLRGFLVTHFFQLTKHYSFAKLHGQFLNRGPHLPQAFAFFCPNRRRQRVLQNNSGARSVLVFFFERNFPWQTFQVFHHAIARHSIKKGPERSARGVIFFRITHQGHEHVLHNLFCGPRISGHAQGKAIHGRLVSPVDEGESFLIAFGGPPQQNVVSFLLGDSHLPWYDVLGCSHLSIPAAE